MVGGLGWGKKLKKAHFRKGNMHKNANLLLARLGQFFVRSGCLHEQPEVLDLRANHCAVLGATLLERRHPKDRLQRCVRNHSDQQLFKGSPDLKCGQDGIMMDYDMLLDYDLFDLFVLGDIATLQLRNVD